MLRTLVDEGLDGARLIARLNAQVARHSPASRFITFFYALYDPRDGSLTYVNAGHLPGIIRRANGHLEQIGGVGDGGGLALGMFDHAEYEARTASLAPGDLAAALQRRHHRGGDARRPALRGERPRSDPHSRGRRRSGAAVSRDLQSSRSPRRSNQARRRSDHPGAQALFRPSDRFETPFTGGHGAGRRRASQWHDDPCEGRYWRSVSAWP